MADANNSLDGIMQSFVAAEVSLNSNFGDLSFRNGSIQTNRIRTLADYMKTEKPLNLQSWNPELKDDNKLMRTYIVPIVLPNGENIDLVVNSKGQDLAQIYINESGSKRFHLDDSVRDKIVTMAGAEILAKGKYNREFLPKDLEEMAEKISKDELIPKDSEKVETRKKKADDKAMDDSREEENEKKPEEVAEEAGVSLDELEKFCKENGLPISAIKGASQIQKTEKLEDKMEKNLNALDGETIIALRISGINGKINDSLGLMNQDGTTLDMSGEKDELLEKLVPEGYDGDEVEDIDKLLEAERIKIKNDVTGKEEEYDIDPSNKGNGEYFREKLEKIKEKVSELVNEINSREPFTASDAREIADVTASAYGRLCALERESDVDATSVSENMLAEAQAAENKATTMEMTEPITNIVTR